MSHDGRRARDSEDESLWTARDTGYCTAVARLAPLSYSRRSLDSGVARRGGGRTDGGRPDERTSIVIIEHAQQAGRADGPRATWRRAPGPQLRDVEQIAFTFTFTTRPFTRDFHNYREKDSMIQWRCIGVLHVASPCPICTRSFGHGPADSCHMQVAAQPKHSPAPAAPAAREQRTLTPSVMTSARRRRTRSARSRPGGVTI